MKHLRDMLIIINFSKITIKYFWVAQKLWREISYWTPTIPVSRFCTKPEIKEKRASCSRLGIHISLSSSYLLVLNQLLSLLVITCFQPIISFLVLQTRDTSYCIFFRLFYFYMHRFNFFLFFLFAHIINIPAHLSVKNINLDPL